MSKQSGIHFIQAKDDEALGLQAASLVAEQLRQRPDSILVFPTGKTPRPMYRALASMPLDWSRSRLFHLDEYVNPGTDPPAYTTFAREIDEQLWDHIAASPKNKHYFRDVSDPLDYERAVMGPDGHGPDMVILGVGGNGHIAFNEPGSLPDSPSRVVDLAKQTILSNFGALDRPEFPRQAVTLGLRAILAAKAILLLATGESKKAVIQKAFATDTLPTPDFPVSWLKTHPNVTVLTDFQV